MSDCILICIRDTTGQFHKPVADSTYCAGQSIMVMNNIAGMFSANNVFSLELSDAFGSFANPDTIGSIISGVSGYISGIIPAGIAPGSGYRLRVSASSPPAISQDNGSDISIHPASGGPSVSITASPDTNVLPGTPVTFSSTVANAGPTPQYQWRRNNVLIPGATGSSYTSAAIQHNDVIDLYVQSSIPCAVPADALSNKLTIRLLTNIDDGVSKRVMRVFPNPVKDKLFIENTAARKLQIVIIEPAGRLVMKRSGTEANFSVDMENIASGLYLYYLYEGHILLQTGIVVKE